MRLFLTFALLVVISSIQFGEGGIYRRYVRRSRPRPPILHDRLGISRRGFQPYRPHWTSFFQRRPTRSSWNFLPSSRAPRRLRFNNQRSDNQQVRGVPHFHHQQQPPHHHHYSPGGQTVPPRSPLRWSPLSYGNPIVRDPTVHYAPPSIERVRLISEQRSRRTHDMGGGPPPQFAFNPYQQQRPGPPPPPPSYRPSPSLWKMLAHKQRPKRPYPQHPHNNNHIHNPHGMRYHGQSPSSPLYHHQAEIFPRIPNIVYFKPTDVIGGRPAPGKSSTKSEGIGSVSKVPLYSQELTSSSSELRPVAVVKPTVSGSKEYIFTVVGHKGPSVPSTTPLPSQLPSITSTSTTQAPTTTTTTASSTTRRAPTLLHAVKTTPVTPSSTHNSAVKPFEPTESLGNNHKSKKVVEEDVDEEEEAEESKFVEQVQSKDNEESSTQRSRGTSGNSVVDGILNILDMVPPAPVFPIRSNSFNILDSDKLDAEEDDTEESKSNEESGEEQLNLRRPVFNPNKPSDSVSYQTSTSVSVSVSNDKISATTSAPSTRRPLTSPTKSPSRTTTTTPRTTTTVRATTEASTTPKPTESSTTKLPKFANLPVMPKYTRNKTPVYAKKHHHHKNANKPLGKYSSAASSSALSKEMNGSGEIVVITGGRSKVKEYKPQFIADNARLLSFDKVASESSSASSFVEVTSTSASPSSTSTTTSPLQQFDPMQLLHSWLTKSSD